VFHVKVYCDMALIEALLSVPIVMAVSVDRLWDVVVNKVNGS